MVNNALQGKLDDAGTSGGRFILNTTLGVLGIIDMADKLEIPDVDEDFGQTLAVWGVPSGPYLVLPFFGPRYLRGTSSFIVDRAVDPQTYVGGDARLPLIILDTVNTRAEFLGQDDFLEMQIDPYIFLRESYQQRRQLEIKDTAAEQIDDFDDEFEEDVAVTQ